MTTLSTSQSVSFAANANLALNGGMLMFGAGILAGAFRPLNAGPLAFAMFPSAFAVRLGTLAQGAAPSQLQQAAGFTAQVTGQSTAKVDLGDGYHLEIDERSSEMTIVNENGQRTRIWGDPHVDVDGKHQFDFYGTTTFELANGTKLTINTEPWSGNANAYVASQVVVTKGANAVVIDGISQNRIGDLSVSVSTNGYALDAAHRDGFTVLESAGGGWETELGQKVTQAEADITRPGALYGPGSEALSLGEAGTLIGSFLFFGSLFGAGFDASVRGQGQGSLESGRVLRQLLLA